MEIVNAEFCTYKIEPIDNYFCLILRCELFYFNLRYFDSSYTVEEGGKKKRVWKTQTASTKPTPENGENLVLTLKAEE